MTSGRGEPVARPHVSGVWVRVCRVSRVRCMCRVFSRATCVPVCSRGRRVCRVFSRATCVPVCSRGRRVCPCVLAGDVCACVFSRATCVPVCSRGQRVCRVSRVRRVCRVFSRATCVPCVLAGDVCACVFSRATCVPVCSRGRATGSPLPVSFVPAGWVVLDVLVDVGEVVLISYDGFVVAAVPDLV
jgi:hypothetical protein